jgi:ketosteroid isomerase-like protein
MQAPGRASATLATRRLTPPTGGRQNSYREMSENLDLVRSIYANAERGDFRSVDWAHPEIEFVVADGPEPGRFTGVNEMASYGRRLLDAWAEWRVEVEDYRELDRERVLVLARHRGRGKTSGLDIGETQQKGAAIFHVRDAKVMKQIVYWDREHALADLGLEE